MFCRSSLYSLGNAPPQSDVKRARTAVRSPRLFHRKHDRAKRRRAQPMRSLTPKHAPIFGMVFAEVGRIALPGNDQNKICPCVGGAPKKIAERLVRPRLCHAVQIDLVVDMRFSRKQFSFQTPVQGYNRVENRLRRFYFRLRTLRAVPGEIARRRLKRIRLRRHRRLRFFPNTSFYAWRHIGGDVAPKGEFFAREMTNAGRSFHITPAFHH